MNNSTYLSVQLAHLEGDILVNTLTSTDTQQLTDQLFYTLHEFANIDILVSLRCITPTKLQTALLNKIQQIIAQCKLAQELYTTIINDQLKVSAII